MKVLIVPDKFKGTLTAHRAAELMAEGWRAERPGDDLDLLPMSDGGDGFGEVVARLCGMAARETPTVDAARRPWIGRWWWSAEMRTAVVESAQIIGLALLPPKQFHPFQLDTFGLGAVLEAVHSAGVDRCFIGIGGSATNDGGFGLARALGWEFLDGNGQSIIEWTRLDALAAIRRPTAAGKQSEVIVAVDVQNPLLGPTGASRIYGPQKGLRPEDFPLAEACLGRLAEVAERDLHLPGVAKEPGTGAAGGLGFGLRCFAAGRLESGFELFARLAGLEERIRASDLVLTGEGAIDTSTLMGKGVGEVAMLCRRQGVPCVGLAGTRVPWNEADEARNPFTRVLGIAPEMTSSEEAKSKPEQWLPKLAAGATEKWITGDQQ